MNDRFSSLLFSDPPEPDATGSKENEEKPLNQAFFGARTAQTKDEWLTPPDLIRQLGEFDLDPCAPVNRPWDTARRHYTIEDDGFNKPWAGRIWLNPPYGKETFRWLDKLAAHGSGIALIFARTDTKGFHKTVWAKAHAVFFFKGRLKFYHVTGEQAGTANAPSVLVSYSPADTIAIMRAGLRGKLVIIAANDNEPPK